MFDNSIISIPDDWESARRPKLTGQMPTTLCKKSLLQSTTIVVTFTTMVTNRSGVSKAQAAPTLSNLIRGLGLGFVKTFPHWVSSLAPL